MVELKPDVMEDLKEVQLCLSHLKQLVKIITIMDPHIKSMIVDFLKQHQHTFAWSIDDIVGVTLPNLSPKTRLRLITVYMYIYLL